MPFIQLEVWISSLFEFINVLISTQYKEPYPGHVPQLLRLSRTVNLQYLLVIIKQGGVAALCLPAGLWFRAMGWSSGLELWVGPWVGALGWISGLELWVGALSWSSGLDIWVAALTWSSVLGLWVGYLGWISLLDL